MRHQLSCTVCQKPLAETGNIQLPEGFLRSYKCGHTFLEQSNNIGNAHRDLILTSVDGKKHARNYQVDGVDFIVNGKDGNEGFCTIIGDQMRLGKTPQALLALRSAYEDRTPCLILVRSANFWQWIKEYKVWTDPLPLGIYPIIGTKAFIPPGFKTYICSMDTFSRPGTCECGHNISNHHEVTSECNNKKCKCRNIRDQHDSLAEKLMNFGFKLVIVDEAHSFKNPESNRSKALVNFLNQVSKQPDETKHVNINCTLCGHKWVESVQVSRLKNGAYASVTTHCPACKAEVASRTFLENIEKPKRKCGVVMLTGTAIVNRAEEFFIPLNIVAPTKFPSLSEFRRRYLCQDSRGRYSRVSPLAMDSFKNAIAPYFLRREKEDVYTDLPKQNRLFTVVKVEDDVLKKAYNNVLDKLETNVSIGNFSYFANIGELSILRQICGLAKVPWTVEYIEEFLEDNERIAVGFHHYSIRDSLTRQLKDTYGILKLDGGDSAERKYEVMTKFRTSKERICLLGEEAAKEGLEFYYLTNALVLERMWSSAKEEQFEFRFYNPDKDFLEQNGVSREKVTNIEYPICQGTIDEFFYDLIEEKRQIFGETIGTQWVLEKDEKSFKNLLERTVSGRL